MRYLLVLNMVLVSQALVSQALGVELGVKALYRLKS